MNSVKIMASAKLLAFLTMNKREYTADGVYVWVTYSNAEDLFWLGAAYSLYVIAT